jgi:translation initiation factor 1 (eIF-1/SUI1)
MIRQTGGEGVVRSLPDPCTCVVVMTTLQQILPGAGIAVQESPLRRSSRVLRPARTPAGAVVALAVTVALGLTVAEVVSALLGRPLGWLPVSELLSLAGRHTWQDLSTPSAAVAASGGVLLLLAAVPGRSRLVPVETSDPLIVIGITRAGLRRTLRAVAQEVEGVERARVRLRRRRIEVTVITGPESSGSMLRQVGTAVGDRLAGVGTLATGEVVVRLRRRGL